MATIDLADVVNATDILVRYLTCHAYLAMKARQRRAVGCQVIRKEFERNGMCEFQIIGAIDFTHAAFAEQADNAIAVSQDCARYKPRIVD